MRTPISRTRIGAAAIAGLVSGVATVPLAAADGDLDLTFHDATGGIFQVGSPGDAQAVKLLVAPDGATVVLNHYEAADGTPRQDHWLRVTDSAHDPACPLTGPSVDGISAHSAIFDRQGRLVVIGTDYDGTRLVVVERFLYPDCTLDPEFDGNGIAGYLVGEEAMGVDLAALRLGVAPFFEDYYYLVATVQEPATEVALLRLHLDGDLDTSWGGGDGRVQAGLNGARAFARDMEVDAHGRLVVAVLIEDLSPHDFDFGAFRFLSNGDLDASFAGNGKKAIPFDLVFNGVDTPFAIALDNDGHMAIVGTVSATFSDAAGVAVLREDGSFETDFGVVGLFSSVITFGASGAAVAFQSDGKLLIAGDQFAFFPPGYSGAYAARLLTSGTLDPDFGDGGVLFPTEVPLGELHSTARSIALTGGRPMIGGNVSRAGEELDNSFVLRLDNGLIFADGFESRNTFWW